MKCKYICVVLHGIVLKFLSHNKNMMLIITCCTIRGGHSSVVEHSTADREVTGSIPVAPFVCFLFTRFSFDTFVLFHYFETMISFVCLFGGCHFLF